MQVFQYLSDNLHNTNAVKAIISKVLNEFTLKTLHELKVLPSSSFDILHFSSSYGDFSYDTHLNMIRRNSAVPCKAECVILKLLLESSFSDDEINS